MQTYRSAPSSPAPPWTKPPGKKRPNAAKRDEVVPKGAAFMPSVSLEGLTKAHKKEKAGKSKYRLHAALLRKEGKDIRKISRMLGVAYSTVRDRAVRMHAGNPEGAVRPQAQGQGQDDPPGRSAGISSGGLAATRPAMGTRRDPGRWSRSRTCCIRNSEYAARRARSGAPSRGSGFRTASPGPSRTTRPRLKSRNGSRSRPAGWSARPPKRGSRCPPAMKCTPASGPMAAAGGGRPTDMTPPRPTTPDSLRPSSACRGQTASTSAPSIPATPRRSSGS